MAIIRYIEIDNELEELVNIPSKNGQIIYCRDTFNVYCDTSDGHRYNANIIIKVEELPIVDIDKNKIYLVISTGKLYRYDTEFYEVTSGGQIFDIIAENEDVMACYLTKDYRVIAPITSSETTIRPVGETVEESLMDHEREFKAILNPLHRFLPVDSNGQKIFIIPLPYKTYLEECNTFTIYKNKSIITEENYTIDFTNDRLTFKNNISILMTDTIEISFHYKNSIGSIKSEHWISILNQTDFILVNNKYTVGKNITSLYINGIKQPKESYIELDAKTIRLRSVIPTGSNVLLEIGKWIPNNSNDFYGYFETKTEKTLSNGNKEIIFPDTEEGYPRKIVQTISEGKVTIETAYINNIEVCKRTIIYNTDSTVYTVIPVE